MSDDLAKMVLASELAQFRVDIRKLCVQLGSLLLQCIPILTFQQLFRLPVSHVFRLESGWIATIQIRHFDQILHRGKSIVQRLVPTLFAVQDDTRFRQLFDSG